MEVKDKAIQLINGFIPHVYCFMGSGMLSNTYDKDIAFINAKKCAIIAVDDVIAHHEEMFDMGFKDVHIAMSSPIKTYIDIMNPILERLRRVKQAIETLTIEEI